MVFFGTLRTFLASLCLHTHLHYACLALVLLYAPGSGSSLPLLPSSHLTQCAVCISYKSLRPLSMDPPLFILSRFFIIIPAFLYLFTSHPRCFVNPVDTNVWIPLLVSMHSIQVFSFLSYIFFLFRCRWYMINLSILSVVSNIKLSFCRLLHTEATIVLSATIYLFLIMVVFLGGFSTSLALPSLVSLSFLVFLRPLRLVYSTLFFPLYNYNASSL